MNEPKFHSSLSRLSPELESVSTQYGLDLRNLRHSADESMDIFNSFVELRKEVGDLADTDVVLTGSVARGEATRDSDCDYLLVSAGTPSHEEIVKLLRAVEKIRKELQLADVGSQGVFADFVAATELFLKVGLERDSNINTTRRFSVLLESVSVLNPDVRQKTVRQTIERYCAQYKPEHRKPEHKIVVPRLLVNDLIRFWRSLAVDFEAKRWTDVVNKTGTRYAKLLTTRKILFAGSLAGCLLAGAVIEQKPETRHQALVDYLCQQCDKPALARLASIHDYVSKSTQQLIAEVIGGYDRIIGLLNSRGMRGKLQAFPYADGKDEAVAEFEVVTGKISNQLEQIFFEDDLLGGLTKRYSLF